MHGDPQGDSIMTSHQQHQQQSEHTPWYRNRTTLGLAGFLAIAGYFLASEHQAHFINALPYLLLLACPLMHIFMHGGHGHDDHSPDKRTSTHKENDHA
jgi:4-hydroxybenzoate polyprenyltransferase